jgi:integrase
LGSISSYETTHGRRYRAHYRDPDRRNREKAGFIRKRDAEEFLAGVMVASLRGEYVDSSHSKRSITDLGTSWLANQSHLKPSSYRPIEIAWRLHVKPAWGARRIGDIRHSDVQTWISTWGKGRSATTVLRAYGVLAAILDVAVLDKKLASNPARGVNLPRKARSKRQYLSISQVETLVSEVRVHKTLTYVLAYTGLRWGEATALRVGSVDLTRRRLLVEENAVKVGQEIHVGTPKSHEKRSVPYPRFLDADLRELVEHRQPSALLFGDGVNHLRTPHSLTGWFVLTVKRAQSVDKTIPSISPHDLRHTAASLAISAGANVKAVQRMLGHASAAMTLDTYADLFEDDLDEVSMRLDEMREKALVGFL